jgi:hypothetical protein
VSDYHPDAPHIVTGSMLAIVFSAWIDAFAEDREPPPVHEILLGERRSIGALNVCRVVLGVPDETASKMRMMRFFGALADLLERDGAELQCLMHAHLKPDEEELVVVCVPESELAKLREHEAVELEEVER